MHWNEDTHLLGVYLCYSVCGRGVGWGGRSQEGTCFLSNSCLSLGHPKQNMGCSEWPSEWKPRDREMRGCGWRVGPELRRQLKRVEKPGEAGRVKTSLLTAWLCSQHPWCVLKMFVGAVMEAICLVVWYLIPNP